jgi:tetratricopeptide (TPR) repeat protein
VTLNDLGAQYAQRGMFDAAAETLERALAMKRHALGARHPDVAVTLNNLAMTYRRGGNLERADKLYAQATRIFERKLGPTHPSTITCRANRAAVWRIQREEDACGAVPIIRGHYG